MITGKQILAKIINKEKNTVPEGKSHKVPRPSQIWICKRKHVGIAMELIKNDILWYYCEAGITLQTNAYNRIKKEYPDTVQEVAVPTGYPGIDTHPDIYIPSLKHCMQVKSASDTSTGFGKLKPYHKDQVLMEWYFWNKAGYCITEEGERLNGVPVSYEILYLGRESYGEAMESVQITYNKMEADRLAERFEELVSCLELKILPQGLGKPGFECKGCGFTNMCWNQNNNIQGE